MSPNELPQPIRWSLSSPKDMQRFADLMEKVGSSDLPEKPGERGKVWRRIEDVLDQSIRGLGTSQIGTEGVDDETARSIRNLIVDLADLPALRRGIGELALPVRLSRMIEDTIDLFSDVPRIFEVVHERQTVEKERSQLVPLSFTASKAASERARTIFRDATEAAFSSIAEDNAAVFRSAMAEYVARSMERVKGSSPLNPIHMRKPDGSEYGPDFVATVTRIVGNGRHVPFDQMEEKIASAAATAAEAVRFWYVERNASKLAPALDAMGADPSIEIEEAGSRPELLERRLDIRATNGAGFVMTTSVERAVSYKGTDFHRFPCRFSEVMRPDGSAMSTPSAEKIAEAFQVTTRRRGSSPAPRP